MMVSPRKDGVDCEIPNGFKPKSHVSLQISDSRKGLLTDEVSPKKFPGNVVSFTTKFKLQRLRTRSGLGCPYKLQRVPLLRKIEWPSVMSMCKEWMRQPLNMALLLWITCVVVSGAILFLVMTGMLNRVLPKKSQRDLWFEVNNQIINALFTLMCLYQHPKRFYHFALLCRWKPEDVANLRKIYCKNGAPKPKERAHMMVVVILLHLNCFAQYALCALNLGYKRSNRPIVGVGVCLSVAIIAPAVAGLYSMLSPLGKDYDEDDAVEELPAQLRRKSLEPGEELGSFEGNPEWRGGLFHLWEDFKVAYMAIFCCLCVFGWNMERLGFGNMYVHIATFLLVCVAPFLIFNLAAVNIDSDTMREILSITGVVLCLFGLLYGGFWRIKMRKRFKLPPNNVCFGKPDFADCIQWLFCCWCSLAQEVRTGDYYDIVENRLFRKQTGEEDDGGHTPLTPLPREGINDHGSSRWGNPNLSNIKLSTQKDGIMEPPTPSTMKMVS